MVENGRTRSELLRDQVLVGAVTTRNRLVRAGTAETMSDQRGGVTERLVDLYRELAHGSAGLLITGHMYVSSSGRAADRQLGISEDGHTRGLSRLTAAVHEIGAPILAQFSHAGSQSRVESLELLAPSAIPNPLTGRMPGELSNDQINSVVDDFAKAARRAVDAEFDGIHIHGANGYLISEFCSPATNRRTDMWGGDATNRGAFAREVVQAVRANVPAGFPVTFKLGAVESVAGGLSLAESVTRARSLEAAGVDAFEVSCGLMSAQSDSARRFAGVSRRDALKDLIGTPRGLGSEPEATFREAGRAVKAAVSLPVILTGGIRSLDVMCSVIENGDADLIGLSRPLIRQPDLTRMILSGAEMAPACTSCNLCLQHSGTDPLMCWRYPRRRLLAHYWGRLLG